MSNPNSPISFLGLPAEIRIQIYTYILPGSIFYGRHPHHLSIFRVNRQIHEESTQLFYSRTTFAIRITLSQSKRWNYSDSLRPWPFGVFKVFYSAPWEELDYQLDIRDIRRIKDNRDARRTWSWNRQIPNYDEEIMSDAEYKLHQHPGVILLPSPRYRQFLRSIQVFITDEYIRDVEALINFYGEEGSSEIPPVFSPFLWRLREILPETATVNIVVESTYDL